MKKLLELEKAIDAISPKEFAEKFATHSVEDELVKYYVLLEDLVAATNE